MDKPLDIPATLYRLLQLGLLTTTSYSEALHRHIVTSGLSALERRMYNFARTSTDAQAAMINLSDAIGNVKLQASDFPTINLYANRECPIATNPFIWGKRDGWYRQFEKPKGKRNNKLTNYRSGWK